METKAAKSFGVIPVFEDFNGNFLFCLVLHAAGHWAFPKGHPDEGESEQGTALRELKEETGITMNTISSGKVFTEEYSFEKEGVRYHKSVKYFLGITHSMDVETPANFKEEIPELKWLAYQDAKNRLTYSEAKRILDEVSDYLQSTRSASVGNIPSST